MPAASPTSLGDFQGGYSMFIWCCSVSLMEAVLRPDTFHDKTCKSSSYYICISQVSLLHGFFKDFFSQLTHDNTLKLLYYQYYEILMQIKCLQSMSSQTRGKNPISHKLRKQVSRSQCAKRKVQKASCLPAVGSDAMSISNKATGLARHSLQVVAWDLPAP